MNLSNLTLEADEGLCSGQEQNEQALLIRCRCLGWGDGPVNKMLAT